MKKQLDIKSIIVERLKMQSVDRRLQKEFYTTDNTFNTLTGESFVKEFFAWNLQKRKDFIYIISGPNPKNMKNAFDFYNSLNDSYSQTVVA